METLLEFFVDPLLRYEFMRNAMLAAAIVGVTSAVLSCLLVVRHQALLGDAVSHAVLPGVAIGWLAGRHVGIFWGALGTAILAGVAITYVERHSRVKLDAVMGIVFTFAFAIGLAVISVARPTGIDLFHVLLGNVLGVQQQDLLLTAGSGAVVLAVVAVLFRPLQLWSFDPTMAKAVGLPVGVLHYLFTALLSATIVASLQAVGLVLVIAMLVTPGATAYLLSRRLSTMMATAAMVGLVSATGGLYGSYHLDVASGPLIVIAASLLFVLAFCFAPRRGLVSQARRRRTTARRILTEDLLKAAAKTGNDHSGWSVGALAEQIGAPVRRTRAAVRSMATAGLLTDRRGALTLTSSGRDEAVRMVRTHRLLERYLYDAEGVALPDLHDAAEHLEHHVEPATLDDMDRALGRPGHDPHGHPIPAAWRDLSRIAGHPLAACDVGSSGRVAMVGDDRPDLLGAMARSGIVPDATVTVLDRCGDAMTAQVGDLQVELQPDVAQRVFLVGVAARPQTQTPPAVLPTVEGLRP